MAQHDISQPSYTNNDPDVLKILIATDCHLGYAEDDPIIGNDSFNTFEEIMIYAVEKDVDMILLGGDLFHHNNPSQRSLHKCMSLLRQYTMGDKAVFLELLSDASMNQIVTNNVVNYLDHNLNVSIPVFSIHGNHDDPSGAGQHSSLDTLASAGLINYFGKWTDLNRIEIRPILLKKGETKLALFGLSHIKDERLSRLFIEEKVVMVRPKETPDDWFNILVLHQNRVDRGAKRFIPDSYLPNFLDLVVWGHEHDCDIVPEKNLDKGFYITQPGSSVPTSLSEGETKPKHVGLLEIRKKGFKMTPLKLRTTRPFVWDMMSLYDIATKSEQREAKSEEIRAVCHERVQQMIDEAAQLHSGHPKQPLLPLVRLRCDYSDESQLFNVIKFGQMFYQKVANPETEVIRLKKMPKCRSNEHFANAEDDVNKLRQMNEEAPELFTTCVEELVEDYFKTNADKSMLVLSVKGMAQAVADMLDKDDVGAVETVCQHQYKKSLTKLMEVDDLTEENILDHLDRLRIEREGNPQQHNMEVREALDNGPVHRGTANDDVELPSDDEFPAPSAQPSKRGGKKTTATTIPAMFGQTMNNGVSESPRARGRGRGSRGGGRGSRGGRQPKAAAPSADMFASHGTRRSTAASTTDIFAAASQRSTPARRAAAASSIVYQDFSDSD